jgi:hypothetical protein
MDPCQVQRLVGVDVAHPGQHRLIEDDRLERRSAVALALGVKARPG